MKQKMKQNGRITIDPKIMMGKPIIKGTRIPVQVVLNLLSDDRAFKEIIEDYPDLIKQDILAAITSQINPDIGRFIKQNILLVEKWLKWIFR